MKLNYIYILVKRASLLAEKYSYKYLEEYNLTLAQFKLLRILRLLPDKSVRIVDLQDIFFITHPTAIGIVRSLENKGLVTRKADSDNPRVRFVCLTSKGRKLSNELDSIAKKTEKDLTKDLTAEERKTLTSLLRKIQESELAKIERKYSKE